MLHDLKFHVASIFYTDPQCFLRLLLKRLTVVAEEVLNRCPIVDDLFTNYRQTVGQQYTNFAHNIDEYNAGMLIYLR